MIVSHKYKFIFIKTKKTAGTSIEVFLSELCGEDDVFTPINPPVAPHRARNFAGRWNPIPEIIENRGRNMRGTFGSFLRGNRFYNHMPARIARHRLPASVWNDYFKFCVVRNPWDKTLSHYHMENNLSKVKRSLSEFLAHGRFYPNTPIYTGRDGGILVDKCVRYESLNDDLGEVFGQLGIPFENGLGVRAKSNHRRDRRSYQDVYTPHDRDIVARAFADEIALHDYSF